MVLGGRLSRFPFHKNNTPIELHQNTQTLNFNHDHLNIIKGAIVRDPVHLTVYRLTLNGWPDKMQDVQHLACHLGGTRDELTVEDSVLLKGSRICIPPDLHDRTLYELHDCHQGIEKMTHIARANIYWPGIDADYVIYCTICAKHKASQAVQPMLPCNVPDRPWQELASNYFTHCCKEYLLIAHPFSKYPFIFKVHSMTSDSITNHLQDLFPQYGTPRCFYSDNGPPFSSEPFSHFYSSLGIDHITSSPLYPKSNGFIEWQVKTIKTSLTTTKPSGISINHLLQTLCSTPIGPNLPSPHEILLNHRDYKPGKPSTPVDLEQVSDYLITKKTQQMAHYEKRHKAQPPIWLCTQIWCSVP